MGRTGVRVARAFAPGHVTGIFVPDLASPDPRGRGSRGAGIVLGLGATAEATRRANSRSSLRVAGADGEPLPITEEAARHLVPDDAGAVTITVRHDLSVGQGFGMSAAGTVAASLALAALFSSPRQRAVEVAHLAELFGGGGLGGVPAVLGGGLEVRARAGIPPWGRVVHTAFEDPVLVGLVGGPIRSPALLGRARFLARVRAAAGDGLDRLAEEPTADELMAASERFTDRLRLAPPPLRTVLRGLRRRGARAAQAMLGRSFFATVPSARVRRDVVAYLESTGTRTVELAAARQGARLLRGRDASILTGRPSRLRP